MATQTSIISIQSQVVHGHVGNSSAVLPMQLRGLNVAAVPTTLLSNHPGYQTLRGRVLEPELVGDLLRGVEERGLIERSRFIVSGYLGTRANGEVVATFVERAKKLNPDIVYICDPVMGDINLGVFVADQVVECLLDRLIPLADLLTPNQFEAGLITQTKPASFEELEAEIAMLQVSRSARLVVTSCVFHDTPDGSLENIVFEEKKRTRLVSPRLPIVPVGTGDLFTGLLTANLARGRNLGDATRNATAVVLAMLRHTISVGEHEMQFGSSIDMLKPTYED